MRATVLFGVGDVHIETIPDARLIEPTDAVITIGRACICGSDLWPYRTLPRSETGRRMGHEAGGSDGISNIMSELAEWDSFYVIVGPAAGAMIGVFLVAIV